MEQKILELQGMDKPQTHETQPPKVRTNKKETKVKVLLKVCKRMEWWKNTLILSIRCIFLQKSFRSLIFNV
jgi:hypothetical protein